MKSKDVLYDVTCLKKIVHVLKIDFILWQSLCKESIYCYDTWFRKTWMIFVNKYVEELRYEMVNFLFFFMFL